MPATSTRYELLDRIAIGGMAELFRARIVGEQGFYKVVAIKRILPQYANDELFVRMLVDEARTASHLSHPNIAEVFELRRDADGGLFIAMEYVPGPSLAGLLAKLGGAGRRMHEACALDVTIHLLEALDHAHRMCDPGGHPLNLVHRDVSPDNVLITRDGAVKLTDFGVAKARGRLTQTQQGTIKGKLAYMSPEQVRGVEIDARADIFAAGIILWESLTGLNHYDAEGDFQLMQSVAEGRGRTLAEVGVEAAPELEAALAKALAFEAADRYQRAGDFARDLAAYHRRTWSEYTAVELGALVEEFFKERFELLAERLSRFESGIEKPAGVISLASPKTGDALPASDSLDDGPTKFTKRSPPSDTEPDGAPDPKSSGTAVWAPSAKPGPEAKKNGNSGSTAVWNQPPAAPPRTATRDLPRRNSRAEVPKAAPARKSSKAEVPAAKPKLSKVDVPTAKVAEKKKPEDAADDRAISEALKRDASQQSKENPKPRKALSLLVAVLGFALAVGLGIGGMAWLRGYDPDGPPPDPTLPMTPLQQYVDPSGKPFDPSKLDPKKVPHDPAAVKPPKDPKNVKEPELAPPPANGPKGTLVVECVPECAIEIDGIPMGSAPVTEELVEGTHKIKATNIVLGFKKQTTAQVMAAKTVTKTINLVAQ